MNQENPETPRSAPGRQNPGRVTPALFGVILVCFLLPFVSVSCAGQKVATLRGMDLVLGKTINRQALGFGSYIESQRYEPKALAILAIVAAILGVGLALGKASRTSIAPVLAGVLGVVFLLALNVQIGQDAQREGEGALTTEWGIGYWLSLLLFAAAAATSTAGLRASRASPPAAAVSPPQTSPQPRPPENDPPPPAGHGSADP